jgi:hypothetical protein
MSVSNNYRFTIPTKDTYLTLPIEIKWDFYGRDDSIEIYEEDVIKEIIGSPKDFEIIRFSHEPYNGGDNTDVNYEFNFFNNQPSANPDILNSVPTDWGSTYLNEGFTSDQIYYYEKPFTKSFFKLDFYDTDDVNTQTIYFTVIIPVQQGAFESASISPLIPDVNIQIPTFKLDFVGDKEGFFIYWLRGKNVIDLDTFYMSAKFFNARLGGFLKMMNTPQSNLPDKFIFDAKKYFFYKVTLDYNNFTYSIYDLVGNRVGTTSSIKWYEYVNP